VRQPPSEGRILLLLAAVHFVNLVDFMMVMPMGPDFAGALGIPLSKLGVIGGAYTAAATVVGASAAAFLDRFERRSALVWSVTGLGLSTLACAVAAGLGTLTLARAAAGAFGGLAATLCFSIVSDLVPESRRGRATAVVASGFSISSIVGVPIGLELARLGGWHAPFVVIGGAALLLAAAARLVLPPLRGHLDSGESARLPFDARMAWAFAAFAFAILGNFLIVPNLSAYLQVNLGYPRERLGLLYMVGGAVTLVTMRLGGAWTDRSGATRPVLVASLVVSLTLLLGAAALPPLIPPLAFFVGFMGGNTMRWVAVNALSTRVPAPSARARYLSAQNAFVHGACSVAAYASTLFLSVDPADGKLVGMNRLALAAALLGLGVPVAVWRLQRLVGAAKPV
jgi:predicted MFS family arabinose efflux permease